MTAMFSSTSVYSSFATSNHILQPISMHHYSSLREKFFSSAAFRPEKESNTLYLSQISKKRKEDSNLKSEVDKGQDLSFRYKNLVIYHPATEKLSKSSVAVLCSTKIW